MIHVTDILKQAGLVDTTWLTQHGRERGSAVHAACEYDDLGDLDEATVADEVRPYLASYRKFRAEMKPEIHEIEQRVVNEVHQYEGRVDRIMTLNHRRSVVDIKSGGPSPADALQLAGYQGCLQGTADPHVLHRYNLYLLPGAAQGYRLVQRTDRDDWQVFLAALTVARWKEING